MSGKKIKDPLYGYINIPSEIMSDIIDSAVFQRLRRINQTSYGPLFPSAVHTRFVHSLGVYHLGKIAAGTLRRQIESAVSDGVLNSIGIEMERLEYVFLLACLLHDVGHAPFSHTGEVFYLEDGQDYSVIHNILKSTVATDNFAKDVPAERSSSAAPHEIMSAIIGIREFGHFLNSPDEKEFFARCIIGYTYSSNDSRGSLLNCFVSLLNSKVIDVDKLDYLIRDAYITGFRTVDIDYERLLTSLTIVNDGGEDGTYSLAYSKGAFSIIENVVYAHDSERKWVQSHPIILYESYILQHIMEMLTKRMDEDGKRLFSLESLSVQGQAFRDGTYIRLMSDDDIVYLAKKYYSESELVPEFFERKQRRHPLWKSESEYKTLFLELISGGEILSSMESAVEVTAKYLSKNSDNWVINDALADTLRQELSKVETSDLDEGTKLVQRKEKTDILKVVEYLNEYAKSVGYYGDFVLIKSSQFNSGFSKPDFSSIRIVFPSTSQSRTLRFSEKVSSILGITSERDNFFYLYYDRNVSGAESLDAVEMCKGLLKISI